MLYQDAKLEELEPKSQKEGKRFKVIIQGGETYIQATDSFEEVFGMSKSAVDGVELIEVLDPFLFDTHKDVIRALF
jgi:hypothetical protein